MTSNTNAITDSGVGVPICQQGDDFVRAVDGFARSGRGRGPLKRDLIDLDHDAVKRLAFRMASLGVARPAACCLLPADPASVELTTRGNEFFHS
jgi:hypothetical protein